MNQEDCEHSFVFKGLVYSAASYPLPGSGAHQRIYEDAYYCNKCLLNIHNNVRHIGNTYGQALAGSFPK